jgi:hypothetical protein
LLNLKPDKTTVHTEIGLWNNKWVVILLITLAGVEWIVRRRYDLP